jgi:hypothetical protein
MSCNHLKTPLLGIALALAAMLAAAPADARGRSGKGDSGATGKSGKSHSGHRHSGKHHHRHRSGYAEFYGPAAFWPWRDYMAYPVIATAPVPVQYIERTTQEAQPADHWLYCTEAQGYFPHVGDCPGGWERVPSAPFK